VEESIQLWIDVFEIFQESFSRISVSVTPSTLQ
jgi:hypothetical protein